MLLDFEVRVKASKGISDIRLCFFVAEQHFIDFSTLGSLMDGFIKVRSKIEVAGFI